MTQKIQYTVCILLFAMVSANANGSSQLGYGSTKCSIYNVAHKSGGELVSNIDSWALGYLSGLNHAAVISGKADELRRQQADRVVGYLQSYCESQTNKTIEQAISNYWATALG